jgi:hypothetical protein
MVGGCGDAIAAALDETEASRADGLAALSPSRSDSTFRSTHAIAPA